MEVDIVHDGILIGREEIGDLCGFDFREWFATTEFIGARVTRRAT